MKVLHICPGYFGANLYEKLFSVLKTMNIVNEVFTLPFKNVSYDVEKQSNLKVFEKKFNFLERIIYFRKQHLIYKEICREYAMNEFNIIHAHTLFSAGFSAYLIHKNFGLPYIVAIRNTDVNVFFRYMFHLNGIGRDIMYNAQNIIFLAPSYRDFVIDKYVDTRDRQIVLNKSLVIPNGIDEYFLNNKQFVTKALIINSVKLIFIGDIDFNKNIETTIKACKLLIKKGYSVNYTVIGEILDVKFNKIITRNGFISYYPRCSKEEILFFLRHSDIFIMPSIYETFGLVYAEAMSQGLPIIYSKGQGFDGQFEDGVVGYSVNCFDYEEITQKIIDVYKNYQKFSERCVSLVDKFDWLKIAAEYKMIYQSAEEVI